ncbi:ABC transporter ATP-binding protein [Spectribacter hydrogenoxidans]|uniref:ABC transporter ATP-binding protein n=1 Tax=Spectribacter hydrogenoxidans TaxID=3075608 RepID=A0ABU3BVY8_9GAMM|nr:ABC transporter ATP-binding protein [Salinisphaera sp. W335]MDT0633463.1 ABC transporter ATP-binding protein [Salinisphaera sp. W335]
MLLKVANLQVSFDTPDGPVDAVRGLDFELAEGQTLGIVGESGSGKSQSVRALLGLLDSNGRVSGSARYRDTELIGLSERELRRIRGSRIAMIFQDPMTSLNPHLRVSTQMTEVLAQHQGLRRRAAMSRAIEMLEAVRIPDAARRIRYYPHQFSGGMRQRVMIAMSLLCQPDILIADEPTTALDVTVQAEILDLIRDLRTRFSTSVILITHDLGVVAGTCDHVVVMRDGEVVERAAVGALFDQPQHDYTRRLLAAVPKLDAGSTN